MSGRNVGGRGDLSPGECRPLPLNVSCLPSLCLYSLPLYCVVRLASAAAILLLPEPRVSATVLLGELCSSGCMPVLPDDSARENRSNSYARTPLAFGTYIRSRRTTSIRPTWNASLVLPASTAPRHATGVRSAPQATTKSRQARRLALLAQLVGTKKGVAQSGASIVRAQRRRARRLVPR